jgi:D-alanine--poly(phosphoribitol) ligase subunit 2
MLSAGVDLAQAETEAVIHEYLAKRFPKVATLNPETSLFDSGIIDSLGVLELMTFLSERFGIQLEDSDFDPANLATPGKLVQFVLSRRRN